MEGDESITVKGSASALTVTSATITITDDDTPSMSLAVNPASVSEGAGDTTVTVTASTGGVTFKANRTVTVSVGKSGDSAASGTDYDAVTAFDITITKGDTSHTGTFTLKPTDDTLVESDESITVSGTTTGYTVTGASVTLTDNDDTAITLTATPSSVGEGAGTTSVTVKASTDGDTFPANRTVTVSVGDSADSATSGTDYAAVTDFDVTIKAGDTSGSATFTLTPTNDTLIEGNETISVDGAATDLTVNGTDMTLNDDDGPPVINLSVNPTNVLENAGATTVTVTATFNNTSTYLTAKTVAVTVGKNDDSAKSGTDYAAVTGFDVTIDAGKSSGNATFTLTPTNDTLIEGNETITVSGTNADLTVNGTDVTLTDDDTPPEVNLAAKPSSVKEGDGATKMTVSATFSNDSTYLTDTTVRVTVGDSNDSATSGTDYTAAPASFDVTIPAQASAVSVADAFTLTPTDDTLVEGDETITVSGTTTGLKVNSTSVTLTDDDTPPEINLLVAPSSVSEGASATTVTVTATFSNVSTYAADTTVTVTVGKSGDSALKGTDYTAEKEVFDITIAARASSSSAPFTLTPTDDTLVEGDETITVDGTATDLTVNSASVTLTDDDTPPEVNLSVDRSVPENAGPTQMTLTAAFSNTSTYEDGTPVTVTVGAAADSATEGTDYQTVTTFTVTIPAGESTVSVPFTLTPVDDTLIEGDEGLTVSGSASSLTVNDADVDLIDDDGDPAIILSVSPLSVAENASAATVMVTAEFSNTSLYEADTTVTVTVGASGDSALKGTDYTAEKDVFDITIAARASSGSAPFTLTPTDDTLVEGDETITVDGTATGGDAAATSLPVRPASLTLTDDDAAPEIDLSVQPARVAEGAGATPVTLTATFSNTSTYEDDTTVTVTVGAAADSATEGTDYQTVASFTVTIAAGASSGSAPFTLTPIDDTLIEGEETTSVAGTADNGLPVNGTHLTLVDDDTAIDLSVTPARVAEDAGATTVTVTAAFSNAVTYDTATTVTVTVGAAGDSATEGVDYQTVASFTVTIAAGASSGGAPFTLTPIDDTLAEGDETISVNGAADNGLTVNGTHLTLVDDDVVINLSVQPARVAEDAGATSVTLTAAFSPVTTYDTDTTVTVTVGAAGDSATEGVDYQAVASFTVTIAAGQTSGSTPFTLTPIDDTLVEGDETLSVNGTADRDLTVNGTSVTLVDDDVVIDLSVKPGASVAEDAGATSVTLTAAFSPVTTYDTDTTVTVTVGAAGDSATEGVDYQAVASFTVTIAAGRTSGSAPFTLTPIDDTLVEDDETISVNGTADRDLTVNGTRLTLTDAAGATAVAVSDDASDDFATVTVSNARALEGDTMTFTLTLDEVTTGSFTVTPVYSDDTATKGVDYTPNTSPVAFAGQAGEEHIFTVATLKDKLVEPAETFGVSLRIVGPSGIRGRSGSGTIDSNDVVTVVAVIPQGDDDLPTTLHEAGGPRVMTARVWANGFTFSTAMTFTVQVGDGGGTAQEGVDYETVADFDVTIEAGDTSATRDFTVTPIDDRIVEGDETIVLDGTLPGYEVAPSTLTILDDDAPEFSLAVAPTRVRESDGPDAGDGDGRDRRRHLPGRPQRSGKGQRRHRRCRRGLRPGGGLRPPHCERRRERRRDVHARPDRRRRCRGRRDHRGGRGGQRQHGGRPDRHRCRSGGRLRTGARIRGAGRRHRGAEPPGRGQPRPAAARRPRHAGEQHRGAGRVRRLRRRAGVEPGDLAGHARRVLRQRRDEPGAGPGRRRLPGALACFTGRDLPALQAQHPVGLRRLPGIVGPQRRRPGLGGQPVQPAPGDGRAGAAQAGDRPGVVALAGALRLPRPVGGRSAPHRHDQPQPLRALDPVAGHEPVGHGRPGLGVGGNRRRCLGGRFERRRPDAGGAGAGQRLADAAARQRRNKPAPSRPRGRWAACRWTAATRWAPWRWRSSACVWPWKAAAPGRCRRAARGRRRWRSGCVTTAATGPPVAAWRSAVA